MPDEEISKDDLQAAWNAALDTGDQDVIRRTHKAVETIWIAQAKREQGGRS